MQSLPPSKYKGIKLEPTRRSIRTIKPKRARHYSGSDESTIPAVGRSIDDELQSDADGRLAEFPVSPSAFYECVDLVPTPTRVSGSSSKAKKLSVRQSSSSSPLKRGRVRRTALQPQCLEDLYSRSPDNESIGLLPLTMYDRVVKICRRPFQHVDEWLDDGFPKCFELCQLVTQPTRLTIWLAKRRLIANRFTCAQCVEPMILRSAKLQRHMYLWACRVCNRKFSIRIGSMFLKAGVLEPSIILVMYLWSTGYPMEFCAAEVECTATSARWYICLALKSAAAQLRRDFRPLTGVVELEWSVFLQATKRREGLSLLCGVERSTRKVFAVRCANPDDKANLRRLIQTNVARGSVIITRDSPVFTDLQLRSLGYPHYLLDSAYEIALDDVVIDLSMVDDFIEGIKSHIRRLGGPGIFCMEIFLAEVIIRRTWGSQLFPMLIYSLAQAYHVHT